jgi:hypothetical protein
MEVRDAGHEKTTGMSLYMKKPTRVEAKDMILEMHCIKVHEGRQ